MCQPSVPTFLAAADRVVVLVEAVPPVLAVFTVGEGLPEAMSAVWFCSASPSARSWLAGMSMLG